MGDNGVKSNNLEEVVFLKHEWGHKKNFRYLLL